MTFLQEEEVFPTVNSFDISATEEVKETVNLSNPPAKEEENGNNEAVEGKQNGKRKLDDMEATKKVYCFLFMISELIISFFFFSHLLGI